MIPLRSIAELAVLATGREQSLFAPDLASQCTAIEAAIQGRRLLVIGGAGSIGAATVSVLATCRPAALHVVDQSENGLAEVVRDLRSRPAGLDVRDFRTLPLDFGSPLMERFLRREPAYDRVLNFAAVKHVRSEKDVYSLLQMFDTNVLKQARFLGWLAERGGTESYFAVSTDKAANPVNLMGASKRLMEHVLFSGEVPKSDGLRMASARFANVAFSEGSLLQSWLRRIEKRQPLAVPLATRRFFVSLEEAGAICVLAALCAPDRCLLVPRLDAQADLRELETIAVAVVRRFGFTPVFFEAEAEARQQAEALIARGRYAVLRTPLDTVGEKPYEEFVGVHERTRELGLRALLAVEHRAPPPVMLRDLLGFLETAVSQPNTPVTKSELVGRLGAAMPEFAHAETGRSLDSRM